MGDPTLLHRGRMPVFHYLRDEEIATAYVYPRRISRAPTDGARPRLVEKRNADGRRASNLCWVASGARPAHPDQVSRPKGRAPPLPTPPDLCRNRTHRCRSTTTVSPSRRITYRSRFRVARPAVWTPSGGDRESCFVHWKRRSFGIHFTALF